MAVPEETTIHNLTGTWTLVGLYIHTLIPRLIPIV